MIRLNPVINSVAYIKVANILKNSSKKTKNIPRTTEVDGFCSRDNNGIYNAFISMRNSMSEMAKYIIRRVH